jgi:hypothetical protein
MLNWDLVEKVQQSTVYYGLEVDPRVLVRLDKPLTDEVLLVKLYLVRDFVQSCLLLHAICEWCWHYYWVLFATAVRWLYWLQTIHRMTILDVLIPQKSRKRSTFGLGLMGLFNHFILYGGKRLRYFNLWIWLRNFNWWKSELALHLNRFTHLKKS